MGSEGFEPSKAYANRFTVCPLWPLGKLPRTAQKLTRVRTVVNAVTANCRTRTDDPEITSHVLYQLS